MKSMQKEELRIRIYENRTDMGKAAAADFAEAVKKLLADKPVIRVIFAAAPSQNDFLRAAVEDESIDFSRIDAFHMDEYIGLASDAPQGFGNFLKDRIFSLRQFHSVTYLDGQSSDPEAACRDYAAKLNEAPVDIVCMGIGENGHIAFNDPHVADLKDPKDVKVVALDEVCRMQQVHDGCFDTLAQVPTHAMTLTVPRLARAEYHFCVVPAPTKAQAVKRMLCEEISAACPCTVLRSIPGSVLYLDPDSSSLL